MTTYVPAKKRTLLFASVLVCLSIWPAFVIVSAVIDWFIGEGQLSAQIGLHPLKALLGNFLAHYASSFIVAVPMALIALIDFWFLGLTRWLKRFRGMIFILSAIALALYQLQNHRPALIAIIVTSIILMIAARLFIWIFSFRNRRNPVGSAR